MNRSGSEFGVVRASHCSGEFRSGGDAVRRGTLFGGGARDGLSGGTVRGESRRRHRRPAFVLVAVLVCVLTIGLLSGMLARNLVSHHRRSGVLRQNLQSMWLAESGVRRAVARLAADPGYGGEQWDVPAEELEGPWPAVVTIRVRPDPADPALRQIEVRSQYPPQPPRRAVHERTITVSVDETGDAS